MLLDFIDPTELCHHIVQRTLGDRQGQSGNFQGHYAILKVDMAEVRSSNLLEPIPVFHEIFQFGEFCLVDMEIGEKFVRFFVLTHIFRQSE